MKFAKGVVKHRVLILVLSCILMIPSVFGAYMTRINYDMLEYLPDKMDTVIGQNVLLEDFSKGAFSFIVVENMNASDVNRMTEKIEDIEHVETVLWYDSLMDMSFPIEFLPDTVYDKFNTEDATLVAVFLDSSTSEDASIRAIREIRKTVGKQCFVSGMTALVCDLKDLCEKEEPIYVSLAVLMATIVMVLFLDNWIAPIMFIISILMMILLNLGTNIFLGEISYITKALSAVLQLAVTMDYSIFLWHSFNEQLQKNPDKETAMQAAIHSTLKSVIGSSVTTVAGFIALCFMSFTLGMDLGIVMAKGVILGVIGCVTVLPSMILCFDKLVHKCHHKPLMPNLSGFSRNVIKIFPVFLIIFVLLLYPSLHGYMKTNEEVYYDLGECLPENMDYVIAKEKLHDEFDIASTHMVLLDSNLSQQNVSCIIDEMEAVDGVKYVLGLESAVGKKIPKEILPDELLSKFQSGNYELLLINSEYEVAGDEVNAQIEELNTILKKYDKNGMLIGEAPCMKDMIETTDRDFRIVNIVSVLAIFIIILVVEKSFSIPILLIAVIELAIFINLGLAHYMHQSLPFIAPICISTIQLGATVDYAILMTTRYKEERLSGCGKKQSVITALKTSAPSIFVSGLGLFAATFFVACYSDIDMISSMCMLLARGAVISMVLVIFIVPSLFMLCDKCICKTTFGMGKIAKEEEEKNEK